MNLKVFLKSGAESQEESLLKLRLFLDFLKTYQPDCTDDAFEQICQKMEKLWDELEACKALDKDALVQWLVSPENTEYSYDLTGELEELHRNYLNRLQWLRALCDVLSLVIIKHTGDVPPPCEPAFDLDTELRKDIQCRNIPENLPDRQNNESEKEYTCRIMQYFCKQDSHHARENLQDAPWNALYPAAFGFFSGRKKNVNLLLMDDLVLLLKYLPRDLNFSVLSAQNSQEYAALGVYYRFCSLLMRCNATYIKFYTSQHFSFEIQSEEVYVPCRICTELYHGTLSEVFLQYICHRSGLQKACLFLGMFLCASMGRFCRYDSHSAEIPELRNFIFNLMRLFDDRREAQKVYCEIAEGIPVEHFLCILK